MNALAPSQRRGACPGLSAPMTTGDGLLVRFLPMGTTPLAAFAGLCAAARTHGNGIIEVTSRGSIQIRGLSADSAARFATEVASLEIAAEEGIPVHADPLSGIGAAELLDTGAIAAALRQTLAQRSMAARLSPKVSVAIDGGGTLGLSDLSADIRLCAQTLGGSISLNVSIGDEAAHATDIGNVDPAAAVEATVRLLDVIARHGSDLRARDVLASDGAAPFHAALFSCPSLCRASAPFHRIGGSDGIGGQYQLKDGSLACGLGPPFGHVDAASLERLIGLAETAGARGLRAAPSRTLLAIGVSQNSASSFIAAADRLGFIVRADDPRRYVIACAGAPVCASAHIATRDLAPHIAEEIARGEEFTIHLSGCGKGCARSAAAALTVVGTPDGCALIANGSVRDAPFAVVSEHELPDAIADHVRSRTREAAHV